MTEAEARAWIASLPGVSRETLSRFDAYAERLIAAAQVQNLISASSLRELWSRHFVDSAQLANLTVGTILDVGSGAGLPGIPLAILGQPVTLVEPRRRRVEFLYELTRALGLDTGLEPVRVEQIAAPPFDTITARAYARLEVIFASTLHLSHPGTRWVLPKGRTSASELETARRAWHGDFRTISSITDPEAAIIVAERVRPKAQR